MVVACAPSVGATGLQVRAGCSSWWEMGLTKVVRLMKCATDCGAAAPVDPTASDWRSADRLCSIAEPLTASNVTVRMELSRVRGRSLGARWPTATGCRLLNCAEAGVVMGVTVMLVKLTELEGAGGALASANTTTCVCTLDRGDELIWSRETLHTLTYIKYLCINVIN